MTIIEQAFAPLWRINLIPANLVAISNHVYGIKIVLCNNKGLYQKNSIRLIYLSISHWWYIQKKCHTWLSDRGKFLSHTRRCKIYIFRVGHPCGFVSVCVTWLCFSHILWLSIMTSWWKKQMTSTSSDPTPSDAICCHDSDYMEDFRFPIFYVCG